MKLKFKIQDYQTQAVESVADCFAGQKYSNGMNYRMDPGVQASDSKQIAEIGEIDGFCNEKIELNYDEILKNVQEVQRRQNIPVSTSLKEFKSYKKNELKVDAKHTEEALAIAPYHFDVEMETATGKTYCYTKTILELNKRYGWAKYIIVVPSVAIREGVYQSLRSTEDHFLQTYGKKIKYTIYNSKQLHNVESYSSDSNINVMIINIQAFNTRGKDKRRIYVELDTFQSRRPIDVIKANHPILILDEPQKMEGDTTLAALKEFNPLFVLRYSATHKIQHTKVHRLDAVDAYNKKLVKKIGVRGIEVTGLAGTMPYLFLESIELTAQTPIARIELEIKQKSGLIKRTVRRLEEDNNLYNMSGNLDAYNEGFLVTNIDAKRNVVEFSNGITLHVGEATGDVNEDTIRRIQIRETIRAHFEKEKELFAQGIKVLSLFFIDEVVKYRDYGQEDEKGEYARIFEEEYEILKEEYLNEFALDNHEYRKYLSNIAVSETHNGYFSIDKKGKMVDSLKKSASEKKESTDTDAYNLILKDKERLLSFEEPTRFIFSHSALREGWDNPNVFVMCMLKHSNNTVSRRQEVGRGLRLCVNKNGDRMDKPETVHDINRLTVVANESYKDFVAGLQREVSESLSARPRKADKGYFSGKILCIEGGNVKVTEDMAEDLEFYLIQNRYIDKNREILPLYHQDVDNNCLAEMPSELKPYQKQLVELINGVFREDQIPSVDNERNGKCLRLNDNFEKKEFKEIWNRINRKSVYHVDFDSEELVNNCIRTLDKSLRVAKLQYTIRSGEQKEKTSYDQMKSGEVFGAQKTKTEVHNASVHSPVQYDLIGNIVDATKLTRRTVARILKGIDKAVFKQFKQNPEHFISEASRLIGEQKATIIIEKLSYDILNDSYDNSIFTTGMTKQDYSKATEKLKKHIYDYVVTDSTGERKFAQELDAAEEIVVYAKLPKGFSIPTPVGNYNPDWAVAFKERAVKHIYFVAETKGALSTMQLRTEEECKIECARKFFDEINVKLEPEKVKYDVIRNYGDLMKIVN